MIYFCWVDRRPLQRLQPKQNHKPGVSLRYSCNTDQNHLSLASLDIFRQVWILMISTCILHRYTYLQAILTKEIPTYLV